MNIEDSIEILKNSKKLYLKEKIDSDILEEAIETLLTAYEKEKENNKELRKYYATRKEVEELKEKNEFLNWYFENQKENFVHKDKIKEILGIEEETDTEEILSLLQTIVDENARLEDIEDKKVQIEYNDVFNKGVKSVEDKIKAKIEIRKEEKANCKDSIEEKYLLREIYVLQSLLEKE